MDVSDFTVRLVILFLPGAIATLITDKLTVHKRWSSFQYILHSVLLGFISYIALQALYSLFDRGIIRLWASLFDKDIPSPVEVIQACFLSVFVGLLISAIVQHKVLSRFAKFTKISNKFGDESLYYYFLNSNEVDWVLIPSKEKGVIYEGKVISFSENGNEKEILLSDVKVYSYEDSQELYKMPQIYLCLPSNNVIIEKCDN